MDIATRYGIEWFKEHLVNRCNMDMKQIQITAEIPLIKAVDFKPTRLIPENEAFASLRKDVPLQGTVHFFVPDYRLTRIWCDLVTYTQKAKNFEAIGTPDFSVYANWSNPTDLYNLYRNRLCGQYMQEQGLIVIPTVTWSTTKTYEYAFAGLEKGGTYMVSANGVFSHDHLQRDYMGGIYRHGIKEMVKRLEPTRIIVHGSKELPDADYGNCDVMFFRSKISMDKNYRQHYKAKLETELNEEDIDLPKLKKSASDNENQKGVV